MRELICFVKSIKQRFKNIVTPDKSLVLNFVLGNVTCDMDSFLSSIVLSYFRNINNGTITIESDKLVFNVYNLENRIFVPIINCNKGELGWRLDIKELMNRSGLSEEDFFYFNDVFTLNQSDQQLVFKPAELDQELLGRKCITFIYFKIKFTGSKVTRFIGTDLL